MKNHADFLTLGSGVYYRPFFDKNALSGLYLFLYPIFNLPVYVFDDSTNSFAYEANDYYWKIATDLGYSLCYIDLTKKLVGGILKERSARTSGYLHFLRIAAVSESNLGGYIFTLFYLLDKRALL